MIEKTLSTEFGCEKYCEPVYKACEIKGKDEARCKEEKKDCMSFCQFA